MVSRCLMLMLMLKRRRVDECWRLMCSHVFELVRVLVRVLIRHGLKGRHEQVWRDMMSMRCIVRCGVVLSER